MPSTVTEPTGRAAKPRARWSALTELTWGLAAALCAGGVWGAGLLVCRALTGSDISETPEELVAQTALLLAGGGAVCGLLIGGVAALLLERTAVAALACGLGAAF